MTPELLLAFLLALTVAGLLSGYPVAFVLAGAALVTALLGDAVGLFNLAYISAFPDRIWGIMMNELLLAVPLFIFMGVMLEKSKIAEQLLETMGQLCGTMHAGLGLSVILVGALLAASTGIVGATVVTMGLISLPVMLKAKYNPAIASGAICAAGTLGQIIPPSIVLILLGDQIANAWQTTQMQRGMLSPQPVSVADLFVGALLPGLLLVIAYMAWLIIRGITSPSCVPPINYKGDRSALFRHALRVLAPPLLLIIIVLGSILAGLATATESAAIGALGAIILAAGYKRCNKKNLSETCLRTATITCMVFTILIGSAMFTLVFRGLGGDGIVHEMLSGLPGGMTQALLITMIFIFILGFFLDFIEIIYIVVPIVAPALFLLGAHPIWLAIMIAINLQTSFLTPPFGFALFYLRGVAPKSVKTTQIYRGVLPFIIIQLLMLIILAAFPSLATWLPATLYDTNITPISAEAPVTPIESYGVDF